MFDRHVWRFESFWLHQLGKTMKQLCESKIKNGEYDSTITMMIKNDFNDITILREMMIVTKGHENPAVVEQRIKMLRDLV